MELVEVEQVVGEVSEVEEDVEGLVGCGVEALLRLLLLFEVVIDAELIEVNGGSFSGFL